jgi:hypothetical protein
MTADCAAAPPRLVHNGQARRALLVQLPARFFSRVVGVATGRRGSHDLFDANVGRTAVISRHAAAHVALGDNTDQLAVFCILNHGRAAAA